MHQGNSGMLRHSKYRITSTLAILLLAVSVSVLAKPSNKWRLEFDGGADSAGVIVIRVAPVGGIAQDTHIDIADGTGENSVARAVTAVLGEKLNPKMFHVERDDGEDVLIKKRRGSPNFDVEIISNSVAGVRIHLDRE